MQCVPNQKMAFFVWMNPVLAQQRAIILRFEKPSADVQKSLAPVSDAISLIRSE